MRSGSGKQFCMSDERRGCSKKPWRQFTKLQIDETKTKLIFVRNLVNKQELKEHLVPVLKNTGILDSSHDNE